MPPGASEALARTNFTNLDWGIVAGYLLISLVIGLLVRKYATNMASYIGAGRALGTCLGIATMTGTEMGLITIMYSAEKGFEGGFATFHIALAAGLVTLAVGATGFIVARLRDLRVLTIPEFYERRFGRGVRVFGAMVLIFGGVLNMGLFLKVGSQFIVGITGMSADAQALPYVMGALLGLVLVYTVLGGMISVVITDYIQFVVLSFGLLLTTGLAIYHLGWRSLFDTVAAHMGEGGFNPLAEGSAFGPEYVLWMFFLGLVSCAIWPTAVARALAMESTQAVKRQYMWSSVSFLIRFLIPYFWGICAFVFFVTAAPDLQALFIDEGPTGEPAMGSLTAMPVFLGRILPAGLIGILSAAMIAAFMSTHDSYLLVWSSVITQDIVAPLKRGKLPAKTRVLLTRIIIVVIGGYLFYWGMIYKGKDDIWDYMAITGAIYFTGAFALLLFGLYTKWASRAGAYASLIAGTSAVVGLGPVMEKINAALAGWGAAFELTSERAGLGAVALAVIAMVVFSLIFPDESGSTDWMDTDEDEEEDD